MRTRLLAALATVTALGAALPAAADHGRGFYRQPLRAVVVERTVVYRPAPRVVYAAPAYYPGPAYYPEPVYVQYGHRHHHGCGHDHDAWKWIAGGAIAGAILHGIHHH